MPEANQGGQTPPKPKVSKAKAATKKASQKASSGSDKEKKPRAKRVDYGYAPTSIIRIDKEKAAKFTGQRKAHFDKLCEFDGKTVNDFEGAWDAKDSPRGWLRFYVQNGNATLEKVAASDK